MRNIKQIGGDDTGGGLLGKKLGSSLMGKVKDGVKKEGDKIKEDVKKEGDKIKGEKKEGEGEKKEGEGEGEKKEGEGEGEKKEGEGEGEKKEGDGEKKEGEKGNCDSANTHCIAEKTAMKLIGMKEAIKHPLDAAQTLVKDKVKSAAKTVKTAFTNPAICGKNMIMGITDIIPMGIDKASGAMDKLSKALSNLSGGVDKFFNSMGGREIPGYPNMFGPLEVLYAVVVIKIQNIINKIVLGENADKILSDPTMDPKGLLEKLLKNSEKYKLAANSKEFNAIFKDWLTNYVESVLLALNVAQEPLDRVKDKIVSMVDEAGNKIGTSVQSALSNIIISAIGAVPIVGTIIDVAIAGENIGKKILDACEKPIEEGAGLILPYANKINRGIDYTKCKVNELSDKLAPLMNSSQAGGAIEKKRKNILKTTRRVQKLLSRFTRRRGQHINYAKRLSKLRN